MNVTLVVGASILSAFGILAILYVSVHAVQSIAKAFRELVDGLKAMQLAAETNKHLAVAASQVAQELAILRTVLESNSPVQTAGSSSSGEGEYGGEGRRQTVRNPFPAPNFDLFRSEPVPDATVDDTEIGETTDEAMVELERIEATLDKGFEVENME